MQGVLARSWNMLIGRVNGPFTFRLVLQPLVATYFAARYAISDARAGRPPYGWAVISNPRGNGDLIREGWKHVGKVFVVAVAIDVIYEIVVFRWIYPGQALIVAAIVALLPYLVIRGLLNRTLQTSRRFQRGSPSAVSKEGIGAVNSAPKGRP